MANCSDSHVKQRTVFLYRCLQTNLALAKQVAESQAGEFQIFFEDKNDECRERLFWEFNSLSVVYKKPSERFLKDNVLKQAQAQEKKYFPERVRKVRSVRDEDGGDGDDGIDQPLIEH
jgi:carbohydrate-selective porin OprB